jgi:hypothetical protein
VASGRARLENERVMLDAVINSSDVLYSPKA